MPKAARAGWGSPFYATDPLLATRRLSYALLCMAFSGHVHAAVDVQRLAGDPGGTRPCEETNGFGDVTGRPEAPERDLGGQGGALRIGQRFRHVGFDEAGSHHVDRDAAGRDLAGQRAREAADACLGGTVVGLPGV